MSTFSEVGHAKNAANLEDLISRCTAFGAAYNPSQIPLQIANLSALKTNADSVIQATAQALAVFREATNSRAILFKSLRTLSSRLLRALKACNVSQQTYNNAAAINRKVQGNSLRKKPAPANSAAVREANPAISPTEAAVAGVSTSQQGFDSQVEHLSSWLSLLGTVPAYAPNEADLQLASLNSFIASLKAANTAVIGAETSLGSSRIARDQVLYTQGSGVVDTAQQVKSYIISVFGIGSPQYRQVSKIAFRHR